MFCFKIDRKFNLNAINIPKKFQRFQWKTVTFLQNENNYFAMEKNS